MSSSDRTRAATAQSPATHVAAIVAEFDRAVAAGRPDAVPPELLQTLMTAACRLYSAQIEAGAFHPPVTAQLTSTDIMATASGLLKAGNLAVFELGMWQSWTGR